MPLIFPSPRLSTGPLSLSMCVCFCATLDQDKHLLLFGDRPTDDPSKSIPCIISSTLFAITQGGTLSLSAPSSSGPPTPISLPLLGSIS